MGVLRRGRINLLHYRPQDLSTGDNHPALFTAVSDYASFHSLEFFEIISLRVGGLKTFWTIAIWQVGGVDGQMAMATPYPVVLCRQEHELAMRAGGHRSPSGSVSASLIVSLDQKIIPYGQKTHAAARA